MVDVAGRGEDDVGASVRAAVVAEERPPRDRRDHLGPSDHRTPEWVVSEHGFGGEVVDEILWVVVDHRDLLEHDLPLRVEDR